jgi:predicted lipoprotein
MLSELEQNVGNRSERCKRDEETKKLRSCSVVVRGLFLFEFLVFDE